MAAQISIWPYLHTLRIALLTLPLLIVYTEARIVEWDNLGNAELEDDFPLRNAESFPYLSDIHGGQVDTLAKTRRRREGVYDECCRKSCSYNELYSYCK